MKAFALALLLSQDLLSGFPDPWERFKEGSWVKIRTVMKGDQGTNEIVQTQTLKGIEQGQTSLTTVVEFGGQKREELVVVPKLLGPDAKTRRTDKGMETLTVDGKQYPCKVTLTQGEGPGFVVSISLWEAEGTGILRVVTEVNRSGLGWGSTCTAIKVGEKLNVGGKEAVCTVYEVSVEAGPQKVAGKMWLCPEVPGMTVKSQTTMTMQTGPDSKTRTEVSIELLDFEARK